MHDQVFTIPTADGTEPVRVLFSHLALLTLERVHKLTPLAAADGLESLSPVAIEAVLHAGLEGYRERAADRPKPWTTAEVRELLAGPLWTHAAGDLSSHLMKALTLGLRRGKAEAPAAPTT